jgi:hypothetical protein
VLGCSITSARDLLVLYVQFRRGLAMLRLVRAAVACSVGLGSLLIDPLGGHLVV